MTVSELIEKLQAMPPGLPVVFASGDDLSDRPDRAGTLEPIERVEAIRIKKEQWVVLQ